MPDCSLFSLIETLLRRGNADADAAIHQQLATILERLNTMALDLDKLTADVATLKGLVTTAVTATTDLKSQVAELQAAAAAATTDPTVQAKIDAIDATVQSMEADLAPPALPAGTTPAPTPEPAPAAPVA